MLRQRPLRFLDQLACVSCTSGPRTCEVTASPFRILRRGFESASSVAARIWHTPGTRMQKSAGEHAATATGSRPHWLHHPTLSTMHTAAGRDRSAQTEGHLEIVPEVAQKQPKLILCDEHGPSVGSGDQVTRAELILGVDQDTLHRELVIELEHCHNGTIDLSYWCKVGSLPVFHLIPEARATLG